MGTLDSIPGPHRPIDMTIIRTSEMPNDTPLSAATAISKLSHNEPINKRNQKGYNYNIMFYLQL